MGRVQSLEEKKKKTITAHSFGAAPHGGRYVGEWRHGHRHGQGSYEYANGDRYVGHWEHGQQHGVGTLYGHDGSKRDSLYVSRDRGKPKTNAHN